MEDNKSLTQEDLNLYYYEKMIEKTHLFTQIGDKWTNLSCNPISEDVSIFAYFNFTLYKEDKNEELALQVDRTDIILSLKDLLSLFTDPLDPTPEEFTLFNLEYGVDYIIKPKGENR